MMSVTPFMDESFREWYNSPIERIKRGLSKAIAIEITGTLFSNNLLFAVNIGWQHGKPLLLLSVIVDRGRGKEGFVVLGLITHCGRIRGDVLGKAKVFCDPLCKQCTEETKRSNEATLKAAETLVGSLGLRNRRRKRDDDEPQGAMVRPNPPPDHRGGGLASWP